jgi:hypothetical protein
MTRRSRHREHRADEVAGQHPAAPPALDLTGWVALTLIGGMLGIISLPLVWVFVDRLVDPRSQHDLGETLVQLAIAVALCGGAWTIAGARHRVSMDAASRSVTWTRSIFGLPVHRVRWAREEIKAVALDERHTMRVHKYYWIDLVGTRDRRPLKTDSKRGAEGRVWADALGVPCEDPSRERAESKVPADAVSTPKPVTTRQLIGGMAAVTVVFPAVMWYRSGTTAAGYGIGFAGFLDLLIMAVWLSDHIPADVQPVSYRKSRFDWLAVVWLLSVPFGPLLGWFATEQIDRDNWLMLAGIRVFLSVVLPLVGVLPLLRYVRGRYARIAGLILLIGTAFPLLTAMGSTLDVVRGGVWRDVAVTAVYPRKLNRSGVPPVEVHLADGRIMRAVDGVVPPKGPARLLLLEGLDRVLDVGR